MIFSELQFQQTEADYSPNLAPPAGSKSTYLYLLRIICASNYGIRTRKGKVGSQANTIRTIVRKTTNILGRGNEDAIERNLNAIKVITSTDDQGKRTVEEIQIAEKTDVEEITQFGTSVDHKVDAADLEATRIKRWLQEKRAEKEALEKEGKIQFEMKLHKLKLEAETVSAQKNVKNVEQTDYVDAKLPKIHVSMGRPSIGLDFGDNLPRLWIHVLWHP